MKNFCKNANVVSIILILFLCVNVAAGYGYGSSGNSGSSGSSGSSGGVSASNVEPFSNIIKYEVRYNSTVANKSVEYTFASPELGIYQILINGKENQFDIPVRIETLKNKSKYVVKQAPGIIYKNDTVLIGTKRINYITVRFRIENSWIKQNNLSMLPYLLKWNGTTWLMLKTNVIGKDDNYTYLESPKAGGTFLSIYAISAPSKRSNQTIVSQGVIQKQEDSEDVVPEVVEEIKKDKGLPGFDSAAFIISMILLSIYVRRKR